MKKFLLISLFTASVCFSQTTSNFKLPLQAAGTTATAGSQSDTSLSNRGVNGISLRLDSYLGRWFSNSIPNDTLRNILIMNFSNDIGRKINYLANGSFFLDVAGTVYHPIVTFSTRDSGYLSTNLIRLRITAQGLTKSLAELGVAGDGEGYISGRRQSDSTQAFNRFFAAWNDSVVHYVNGNEVGRYDTSGLTVKRDLILNNGGNLTAPSLKFKIIDVAGGNAVDSVSVGIVAGALGVRAISMSNPIQLPSTASSTLSGKSRLLTASGDTLIYKDNSNNINRMVLSGATSGQVLKWTGSAWVPQADNTGGGGGTGTSMRVQLANGSVNIYPDTTLTLDTLDFALSTGVSYEAKIRTSQHIGTVSSPTFAGLTLGTGGSLVIKNSGGKLHTFTASAGANQPNFSSPNLNGSFTLATIDGGQTFTNAVWNGSVIGSQYVVHLNGKQIQDSINARASGDTISVPIYFTGGMSSYDVGFLNSLRMGRGATTNTSGTVIGDGASGGLSSTVVGKGGVGSQTSDVSIGSNTSNTAVQGTNVGTLSSITAQNASAFGFGSTGGGVRAGAFGAYSVANFDSSMAFNTTATGKHHVDFDIKDTVVLPNGYAKVSGSIVNLGILHGKAYVRTGSTNVKIYIPGLKYTSWVAGSLADSSSLVVPASRENFKRKVDTLTIETYQTWSKDSVEYNWEAIVNP